MGVFYQWTYDNLATTADGTLGGHSSIDNTDIRAAYKYAPVNAEIPEWIVGLTLNNNPTMSDLWNSTPAWGFPFTSSPLAPTPAAATISTGASRNRWPALVPMRSGKITLLGVRQLPDRQCAGKRLSSRAAIQRAGRRARGNQLQPLLAAGVRARLGREFDHGRHLRHGRERLPGQSQHDDADRPLPRPRRRCPVPVHHRRAYRHRPDDLYLGEAIVQRELPDHPGDGRRLRRRSDAL